jgi:hypothetical protein
MRKCIAIFLLMIFTVETIGLTIIQHNCAMGQSREITAVNGLGDAEGACCCCDHESFCDEKLQETERMSLVAPPCCTEMTTYLKLEVCTNVLPPLTLTGTLDTHEIIMPGILEPKFDNPEIPVARYEIDYSPPHSASDYLITLNQLKIPFSGN